MDIRTARKIAENVGSVEYSDQQRREAFWALDLARSRAARTGDRDTVRALHKQAQAIWDYFGNRAVKGKDIA